MVVDSDVSDDASRADKAPPTAGQILKAAREAKDISADRLARALNLDVPAVKAIESDQYAAIGAPVFVRGHLRKYAQLVDIAADEVLAAYERAEEPAERVELHPMKPEERASSEGRLWPYVLLLLIVVGVVVWWLLRPTTPAALEPPAAAPDAAPADAAVPAESVPSSEDAASRPESDGTLVLPPRSSGAAPEPPDTEPLASEAEPGGGSSDAVERDSAAGSPSPTEAPEATATRAPPVVAPRAEPGTQRNEAVQRPQPTPVASSSTGSASDVSAPARSSPSVSAPTPSDPEIPAPSVSAPTASARTASAAEVSAPSVSAPTIEQELFSSGEPAAESGLSAGSGLLAEFVFSADSWIDVRDASGTRLVYELGRRGTTRTLRAEAPLNVFLGYADGVEVRIEGRPWPVPARFRRGNTARFTLEAP